MTKSNSVQRLCVAAFLVALGVLIPMVMPVKVVIGPASFTLASHVPTLLAMFISPPIAAAVAAGTALGFLLGGFAPVIVLRAATHIIFAFLGAWLLSARPGILATPAKTQLFSLSIGVVHAVAELLVVTGFYVAGGLPAGSYDSGFVVTVLLLTGVGTVVHSMVDFIIALLIMKVVGRQRTVRKMFPLYAAGEKPAAS